MASDVEGAGLVARFEDFVKRYESDNQALSRSIAEISRSLTVALGQTVSRGEWEQRNNFVDQKFQTQGREIADLRTALATAENALEAKITAESNARETEVRSRRTPTATVVLVVFAGVTLLITLSLNFIPLIAAK